MKLLSFSKKLLPGNNSILRLKILLTVGFILLLLNPVSLTMGYYKNDESTNKPPDSTSLNVEIANAYGIDSFSKIKSVDYTFNVNFNGKVFKRRWKWYPKTKDITYWGKDSLGKDEKAYLITRIKVWMRKLKK